jgi:Cu/Ag efflux pump CusA
VSGNRGDVAEDIEASLAGIAFPMEYHAEVISEDQNAVDTRLVLAISVVALLTGLLLLQVVIGSWRMTAAALATIALSMLGGVAAVLVTGGEATTGTVLGFLAVLTIAVRNVLALIGAWDLARASGQPFGLGLVTQGVGERSVGIVLAGAATALVLLPVTVAGPRPGLEIVHPMAVVVLGGVLTAMLVPLLLFPALYLRWGEQREPDLLEDEAVAGSSPRAWAR